MTRKTLKIGLSSAMMHPDCERNLFKGKRLLYAEEGLFHWVLAHGALPFLLPTVPPKGATHEDLLEPLDALIMSGGADVCPAFYGEEPLRPEWGGDRHRDEHEMALIKAALRRDIPILGICRGLQIINVTLGGALFQDISFQNDTPIVHRNADIYDQNTHGVVLESGSGLQKLYGGMKQGRINSVHHQAIKRPAPELTVEARCADDGIIESVRLKDAFAYVFATQWHPEWHKTPELLPASPILDELFEAAVRRSR